MKKHRLFVILCSVTLVSCSERDHTKPVAAKPPVVRPDLEVIAKLEEIVALKSRLWESFQLQLQAGRAQWDQSPSPLISLCEARIHLAQEKGDRKAVIQEIEKLVSAQQTLMKNIEALTRDRMPPAALDEAKVGLLEAQIRLRKEQARME